MLPQLKLREDLCSEEAEEEIDEGWWRYETRERELGVCVVMMNKFLIKVTFPVPGLAHFVQRLASSGFVGSWLAPTSTWTN